MGTLNTTSLAPGGIITPTELVLTASDTINWGPKRRPGSLLVLRNTTAGALSPTITGSLASASIPVKEFGTVSAAAGLAVGSIPAGAIRVIPLDSRKAFLEGILTITGGTGLTASLLSPS